MKTNTKEQIIEIINKKGPIRPSDLIRLLKISPQAVHRHLKVLLENKIIETRGKPPVTCYMPADIPDLKLALHWFAANQAESCRSICETRDVFSGRLDHFRQFKLIEEDLPLVISVSGEVGNNSFDHNIGQWKDIPGCWFEIQETRSRLWVLIADRGQGIYSSISKVIPGIPDEASAIKKVFEEYVSGRAPEKRGNGLKFVKEYFVKNLDRGIACRSGSGSVSYGNFGADCFNILKSVPDQSYGTITLMVWGKK